MMAMSACQEVPLSPILYVTFHEARRSLLIGLSDVHSDCPTGNWILQS
jgi:hypothetical protein